MSDNPISLVKVEGVLWQTLPEDLYIPPKALEVAVDIFEGPLDLLLYLIRKQNLDILNIPVAKISRQYMAYIDYMQELPLELASEYLLMAAWLAEIKSKLLLPSRITEKTVDDPRKNLVEQLKKYEQIKQVAEALDQLPRQERDIFPTLLATPEIKLSSSFPNIELTELLVAFKNVLNRADLFGQHQIIKEPLSLKSRMNAIVKRLKTADVIIFSTLFTLKEGPAGVVVCFLAILELTKEGFIEISQPAPFAELHISAV
jgi:segregation and condensation protein A